MHGYTIGKFRNDDHWNEKEFERMKNLTRREFLRLAALSGAGAVALSVGGQKLADSYDDYRGILIKGGTLYDGSNASPQVVDVGVKEGKIAAIGELTANGARVVDAKGKIVTPGFIDVHTHVDMVFTEAGNLEYLAYILPEWKGNYNYLYQGVTTVVSGNCGYGHTDTKDWFDQLRSVTFGSNVYHLAPHGVIRAELFGDDQPAELSPEQLEQFRRRIAREMENGAVGLSTGLGYAPGVLSSKQELVELVKVVRRHGGLYATHIRTYSSNPGPDGHPGILNGYHEAVEIGREAGAPVQLSHLQIHKGIQAPVVKPSEVLEIIEQARNEGMDVTADQYPYASGMTYISAILPDRFKSARGVRDEYKTAEGQVEIKRAIQEVFIDLPAEKILLLDGDFAGKTLQEAAQASGTEPADTYVGLVMQKKSPTGILFHQDMDDVKQLAKKDYVFTASDGMTHVALAMKAHPRMYGTFTRKIRKFVLDEQLMDLNTVIRSMTSLPAEKFKMKGRGRVEEGYHADIAVIDLDTVADLATYEKADVFSKGIHYLLVNGVLEIDREQATGRLAGKALMRGE
jgi:N-acyl-D-amino-acid deacylase